MLIIMLLAGLVLASGAVEAPKTPAVAIVKEWKGFYASQEAPKKVVAKDQKEWEEIWSSMQGKVQPKPETPKIDFDKNVVIAVFMGRKMTGGYSVKVLKIEEKNKLVVTVKVSGPPPGAMVTMALTSPYHVVVVPKTDKAVEFVSEKTEKQK